MILARGFVAFLPNIDDGPILWMIGDPVDPHLKDVLVYYHQSFYPCFTRHIFIGINVLVYCDRSVVFPPILRIWFYIRQIHCCWVAPKWTDGPLFLKVRGPNRQTIDKDH